MTFRQRILSKTQPAIIAHRGTGHRRANSRVIENTLDAFNAAITVGANAVECDVRRTSDGQLVVHHDPAIKGSKILLRDMTLHQAIEAAEMRRYELLTLEDMLIQLCGKISFDIELKEDGLEADAAALINKYCPIEDVILKSFYDTVVGKIKQLAPELTVGLLIGLSSPMRRRRRRHFPIYRARRCNADFIAPHWRLMRFPVYRRLLTSEWPVVVWTVNHVRLARRLLRAGATALVTDFPDHLLPLTRA